MDTSQELEGTSIATPAGWQQAAMESGAVKRFARDSLLREVLLRTLLLHVGLGYSLRETVVRARFANWADVAMWLYSTHAEQRAMVASPVCVALLARVDTLYPEGQVGAVRIVDGTIVKESGKTGSQWRILHCIQLPLNV